MAERLKEDICRLVGKQEFDVAVGFANCVERFGMSKLLINEAPLLVLPSLANEVGLNEAIFIQQLHYFCERSRHVFNGNQWVFNTYKQWCDVFPFWSEATIKRTISRLEKMDLVLSSSEFNQFNIDRTKWYRINYGKLAEIEQQIFDSRLGQNDPAEQVNLTKSDEVKLTQWTGQFDQDNNHRLPHIEKDSFVDSENFGEEIHVVSDETTPDPLGVSQSKSTKQAECVEKQFLAVVEVYNRVFANCPAVSKVNLKAKAANQNRKKLIPAAWAIAKDRVLTSWVDEQGLIDGEKPSAKHILEWFEAFFAERLEDPFINGQQSRSKGHENWKADFEYLLKKTNVEKWVYETD